MSGTAALKTTQAKDNCKLAYTIAGTPGKPRVVLIHSLALDHTFWNGVVPLLEKDAEMLVCDCRGHGASGKGLAPGSEAYAIEQFGDDVVAMMDAAGWDNAVIAGCSMGGCVAQAVAIQHPKRVKGLVLVDTTAWYGADAPAQWHERGDTGKTKGMAALVPFQVKRWFSESFTDQNKATVDGLLAVFQHTDVDAYRATCIMMGTLNMSGKLKSYSGPCAVLVGEEDFATPVAMGEALHKDIAQSSFDVIKAGRHLTPVQCPDVIAAAIRRVAAGK